MSARAGMASAWTPLRQPLFRALWIAAVASNVGTWMQDVGSTWLMTSLSRSPLTVALMQTASSLPFFLLALPAGALADVVDRRRLLLLAQGWMLAAAAVMGALTLAHVMTPGWLLALTFTLGLGSAMNGPAWQAITPDLVSREELASAVALGGVGFNLARAVGPALGGLVVAAGGPGAVFLLNAASFLGVMAVLYAWKRAPEESVLPAERVLGAMRAGTRYVRHSPLLRAVLVRAAVFILFGSAMWALLPLVARVEMRLSALGYGALLGCLGLGAVLGASVLPNVRQRFGVDLTVAGATVLMALVSATLATLRTFGPLCALMVLAGIAWMAVMSSMNVAAQTVVPGWVRARALALYLLAAQGGMALGGAVWGVIATHAGIDKAMLAAAGGLVVGLAVIPRFRLAGGDEHDLTPSMHWPAPVVAEDLQPDAGPVLVTVEYCVDPARAAEFARAMQAVRRLRRRDGAHRWGLYHDLADPRRQVETFVVESWLEHLRQHERVTVADREVEQRARAFHLGPEPPAVTHLLYTHS